MLKSLTRLVGLYLFVLGMLMAFIVILLIFADTANQNQPWVSDSLPMLLDLLKVVTGAAVGSLSAAGAMIVQVSKEQTDPAPVSPDT